MPLDSISNPTTEVILGAIDCLETHGWCQEAKWQDARCPWRAIIEAAGDDANLAQAALRRVERSIGIPDQHLPTWNDMPGRTKEEVLDALRSSLEES